MNLLSIFLIFVHSIFIPKNIEHKFYVSTTTIEFKDHYSIPPVINLTIKKNFFRNKLKEKGKLLKNINEYSSGKTLFMSADEIRKILKKEKFI